MKLHSENFLKQMFSSISIANVVISLKINNIAVLIQFQFNRMWTLVLFTYIEKMTHSYSNSFL